jgi:hypothetical protein
MQQMRVGFGTHGFFAEKIPPKRLAEVASWLLRSATLVTPLIIKVLDTFLRLCPVCCAIQTALRSTISFAM